MTANNEADLNFLRQQIAWCQQQDALLAKVEDKLKEMKVLAEYRKAHELTVAEVQHLNNKIRCLEVEVNILQQQVFKGIVH